MQRSISAMSFAASLRFMEAGWEQDMHEVFRFFRAGKLRPVIDSVFPLSELREAEQKMEDRNVFGKIVVKP
jgi:NADPH:quinone reductase-like Zn-dependent oxidoreductase